MNRKCIPVTSKLDTFSSVDFPKKKGVKSVPVKVFPMPWLSCEINQFRNAMSRQRNG